MPTTMEIRPSPLWECGKVIPVTFIADEGEPVEGLPFVVWCFPPSISV